MAQTHAVVPAPRLRNTSYAWIAAATFPVLVAGGFVIGTLLLGDPNTAEAPKGWDGAWRVLVLWAGLEVVPILGMRWGARGVRRRENGARAALMTNAGIFLFFVGVTLIGGLSDALK